MSSTPPDAPETPGPEPGEDTGPRVTRDEARDLARLRRSRTDRKVAGVAGGLAQHLDVDPLLLRVGFVVLAFFGGGGLILYGIAWLLVPEEGTERAVVRLDDHVRTIALIVAGVLAAASVVGDSVGGMGFPWPLLIVGLVVLLVMGAKKGAPQHPWLRDTAPSPTPGVGAGPAAPSDPSGPPPGTPTYPGYQPTPAPAAPYNPCKRGPLLFWFSMALAALAVGVVATLDLAGAGVPSSVYPATVLAVCGVMLLVGAFYGRPGGLIFVGLVAMMATAAASVSERVPAGRVEERPVAAAQVEDSYDVFAGEIVVDLTDVEDLRNLEGHQLRLEAVFGRIHVIVPERGLEVAADGTVVGGEVDLFGNRSDTSDSAVHYGGVGSAEMEVDASVVFGEIVVETETVGSDR